MPHPYAMPHPYSYPVYYEDAPLEMFLVLSGGNGHVVEEAEAQRLGVLRVVAGRANQTKPVPQTSGTH